MDIEQQTEPKIKEIDCLRQEEAEVCQEINEVSQVLRNIINSRMSGQKEDQDYYDDY